MIVFRSGAFIPVDAFLVASIQDLDRHGLAKIVPSPVDKGFDSCPDPGHQQGMYAEPRRKGDGTVEFMLLLPDHRYSRVAANHRHDSLVVIMKRSSRPTSDLIQDIFRSPLATLLGNRTQLRQWQIIRAGNIRKVTQYVNSGESLNREVRPHFDSTAVASRQPRISSQR